ncbi:UvrD-helicase domain-containing protein [Embleya sp. NPDC059237]|uniref:UvrD-helicase domain-containing protein n=1 Tax=unclassified Embleya TaxID=2699296 RepID=UPI0036A292F1
MSIPVEADPALNPDPHMLVIAPPGCGKTELLARRADYLIPRLGPHQQILALTFSNRARQNLTDRLIRAVGAQQFRRRVHVRNFHGYAAEIIRAHGQTIGIDPKFPMPTRNTLTCAVARYTVDMTREQAADARKGIESALREAKSDAHDDDAVGRELDRIGNPFAREIERDRAAAGLFHYDDLLRHAQRLLGIEAVGALYRAHFGAILVDEFQDLSPQQLRIALGSCTESITCVGDPLQGIYSWAGARPVEIEAELRVVCGPPHRLTMSYRSSPAVLGVVNKVAVLAGGETLVAAHPENWIGGGAAVAHVFDTEDEESQWIVDISTKILDSDPTATIGVITREGWRRAVTDEKFGHASHLPRQRWDLAIDDEEVLQLLHTVAAQHPKAEGDNLRKFVLSAVEPSDVETHDRVATALDTFLEQAELFGSPASALSQLRPPEMSGSLQPGVHLLNAHTGKGRQFDWVFVPGIEEFHIPSGQSKPEDLAEELRVLLVMLSRARHGLVVTAARSRISKKGNPYPTTPSRWWWAVAQSCSLNAATMLEHLDRLTTGRP